MTDELRLEYCGEWWTVPVGGRLTIGRAADLSVDDNPYLHRTFLEVRSENGLWLVANVGKQLSATLGDERGHFVAHIAPGGVLPLAFDRTYLRFGAGPTTYEIQIRLPDPPFDPVDLDDLAGDEDLDGTGLAAETRTPARLTPDQRIVVLALAEHAMQRTGSGPSTLPTSGDAARRIGWPERKFNKKLDQVCRKLSKAGVRGLHGGPGDIAANRRAALVEYCLASRIVTADDLPDLDLPRPAADRDTDVDTDADAED